MPVLHGRLICCVCGNDLGDAEDPYIDPACEVCLRAENAEDLDDLDRRDHETRAPSGEDYDF